VISITASSFERSDIKTWKQSSIYQDMIYLFIIIHSRDS
jgi:hypothetical protein